MKFQLKKSVKAQKGFTLVELSVVVLVAGLMLTAVMKGQSMLEGARAQKLLNDVKNVEALVGQFENQKGRLPGDCDRNGMVDYNLNGVGYTLAGNAARAALYDYTGGALATAATTGGEPLAACPDVAALTEVEANTNRWINDLRNANVISRNTTNRLFAKHVAEDFIFLGTWAGSTISGGETFNAITVANVPVAMAKRILSSVNGSEVDSDSGQIRVLDSAAAGKIMTSANFKLLSNNDVVGLIYFYRNQPVQLDLGT